MKSFITTFLYGVAFTLIVYAGENISWQRSASIGICLGIFFNVLADIKDK